MTQRYVGYCVECRGIKPDLEDCTECDGFGCASEFADPDQFIESHYKGPASGNEWIEDVIEFKRIHPEKRFVWVGDTHTRVLRFQTEDGKHRWAIPVLELAKRHISKELVDLVRGCSGRHKLTRWINDGVARQKIEGLKES